MALRWLFLDLNSYFASVEQQLDPDLRGRPVVVAPVMTDSTCAIAASYEAKAYGIKTGTPIHEARARCPDLVVIPARHGPYTEYHQRIRAEIERHLPITHVCSIDEVACRLLDNENDPMTATAIAGRIKRGIAENVGACLRSSIGIAPSRLLAKMASNMQKPDGLTILRSEALPDALYGLTLRDIPGVGARMERRLAAAGLTDMRQFLSLSHSEALRVWGSIQGARIWWELHGHDLPSRPTERRSLGHSHVLAPEMRHEPQARRIGRRLLLKAGSRLRRLDLRAGCIGLAVRMEDRWQWSASERLSPTQDSFAFLESLDRLWRAMCRSRRDDGLALRFRHVAVTLLELTPIIARQPDLFAQTGPVEARHLRLAQAMDLINEKFGRDAAMLGLWDDGRRDAFTGTKIAFSRIPDMAEFHE